MNASGEARRVERSFPYDGTEYAPVTGSRLVLFLIRGQSGWLPADSWSKEMRMSVAWIESGKVFAFMQQVNPGPSELLSFEMTEREMKKRVGEILAGQPTTTRRPSTLHPPPARMRRAST